MKWVVLVTEMETLALKISSKQKGDCLVLVLVLMSYPGVDVQQRRGQGWLLILGHVALKEMVCSL